MKSYVGGKITDPYSNIIRGYMTPYVDSRNFQSPVSRNETYIRPAIYMANVGRVLSIVAFI
jgi:hypothetical protein